MNSREKNLLLEQLVNELDLPESAYTIAKKRYESIGEWLGRDSSICTENQPHVFPQGSFMLGTAVRPIDPNEPYDVDFGCSLTVGYSKKNISQEKLMNLFEHELKKYRNANGIISPLEKKHRCWRLEYADDLKFHVDIVPCIPEGTARKSLHAVNMINEGLRKDLASRVAEYSVSVTDDRSSDYSSISDDWLPSNPVGYGHWFESRVQGGKSTERPHLMDAQVDEMPLHSRKSPLQQVIQIMKRHRDTMFQDTNSDSKPISVIITTLVAKHYQGGQSLSEALDHAISMLVIFVESNSAEVSNPVNPRENFADRWTMSEYSHLRLRENFHQWVRQLQADFYQLEKEANPAALQESFLDGFAVNFPAKTLGEILGVAVTPTVHTKSPQKIDKVSGKPWFGEDE